MIDKVNHIESFLLGFPLFGRLFLPVRGLFFAFTRAVAASSQTEGNTLSCHPLRMQTSGYAEIRDNLRAAKNAKMMPEKY